jgi:hypothetical protein
LADKYHMPLTTVRSAIKSDGRLTETRMGGTDNSS